MILGFDTSMDNWTWHEKDLKWIQKSGESYNVKRGCRDNWEPRYSPWWLSMSFLLKYISSIFIPMIPIGFLLLSTTITSRFFYQSAHRRMPLVPNFFLLWVFPLRKLVLSYVQASECLTHTSDVMKHVFSKDDVIHFPYWRAHVCQS